MFGSVFAYFLCRLLMPLKRGTFAWKAHVSIALELFMFVRLGLRAKSRNIMKLSILKFQSVKRWLLALLRHKGPGATTRDVMRQTGRKMGKSWSLTVRPFVRPKFITNGAFIHRSISHLKAIWLQEIDLVFLYNGDFLADGPSEQGALSSISSHVPLTSDCIADSLYSLTISYSFEIVSCSLFHDRLCDFARDPG